MSHNMTNYYLLLLNTKVCGNHSCETKIGMDVSNGSRTDYSLLFVDMHDYVPVWVTRRPRPIRDFWSIIKPFQG